VDALAMALALAREERDQLLQKKIAEEEEEEKVQ